MSEMTVVTVAVAKGRILAETRVALAAQGTVLPAALGDGETLRASCGGVCWVVPRPQDVPVYVARGAVDLGITGQDCLWEHDLPGVTRVADLGLGACRLVLAAPAGRLPVAGSPLVVATRYPRTTEAYFAQRRWPVTVVPLAGSVELAAVTNLADAVVDLSATGRTLAANGLVEVAEVARSVAVLLASPGVLVGRPAGVAGWVERFGSLAAAVPS